MTTVDIEKSEETGNNIIKVNHTNQTVINVSQDTPMEHIKQELLSCPDGTIKDVNFYTVTGAIIPLCETVTDWNDFPVLCQINGTHMYAINFSFETQISKVDDGLRDE